MRLGSVLMELQACVCRSVSRETAVFWMRGEPDLGFGNVQSCCETYGSYRFSVKNLGWVSRCRGVSWNPGCAWRLSNET